MKIDKGIPMRPRGYGKNRTTALEMKSGDSVLTQNWTKANSLSKAISEIGKFPVARKEGMTQVRVFCLDKKPK